jgi:cytochrome P450
MTGKNHANSGSQRQLPPSPQIKTREIVREPLTFFTTLARQYGDIVCYRPTPEPAYLVSHPDFIRHILVDNNRNYSKATYINQMFKSVVANGLLTAEGEDWLSQRRIMQPVFHSRYVARLDVIITDAVVEMLDRWETNFRENRPVDITREMASLTISITTKALFGVDIGQEVGLIGDSVAVGAALLQKPRDPIFQNGLKAVEEVVYRIINERRRSMTDANDLLALLMQVRDKDTGVGLDDVQLRNQVFTLLLAGYETTSSALTWTWFLLAQNPQVMERLQREVATNIGDWLPTYTDMENLGYTRMVFEEGMRLYPPAWILGRKALVDDELGSYWIPANSVIAISPYVMHRHPNYWENPEAFDPERFRPERSAQRHRFAYIPFGAGPRQCIGNNFAMLEAQLILAMVARRYTLKLVENQVIKPEAIFILRPNQEILMNLHNNMIDK